MRLHIFGLGYTATALAALLPPLSISTRTTPFQETAQALRSASHLLISAPLGGDGDPCLNQFAEVIAGATDLRWIGYCSTTGVYGDRHGGLVNETTPPSPGQERSKRRLAAEDAWRAIRSDLPLDLFRLAGIYGPGRSAFDDLRAGRARRIIAPGRKFGRIHRDDAARAIAAAILRPGPAGARVLHLADDCPAASADVITYAAELLGVPPPPAITLDQALPLMSTMAQSFWAESRLIDNAATKQALALTWLYPSYREGLKAILTEETHQ